MDSIFPSQTPQNVEAPIKTQEDTSIGVTKRIPLSEIEKHDDEDSCWVIIHSKVYDLTEFIDEHPGGDHIILQYAGGKDQEECNWEFDSASHSEFALQDMKKYYVGDVDPLN